MTYHFHRGVAPFHQLTLVLESETLNGGAGDDTLYAGNAGTLAEMIAAGEIALPDTDWGFEIYIRAGAGNDQVFGTDSQDHVVGSSGNDVIVAGGGADVIEGNDAYIALTVTDASVVSASDDDVIYGGSGADELGGGIWRNTRINGVAEKTITEAMA